MIESKQTQISNMGTRHRSIDFSLCFIQTNEQFFFCHIRCDCNPNYRFKCKRNARQQKKNNVAAVAKNDEIVGLKQKRGINSFSTGNEHRINAHTNFCLPISCCCFVSMPGKSHKNSHALELCAEYCWCFVIFLKERET